MCRMKKTKMRGANIRARKTKTTRKPLSLAISPKLTNDQIITLTARIRGGDLETLDLLVKAHRPLVDEVCQRYHSQGLGVEDLIYQGNLGLIKGLQRYKPNQKVPFRKYLLYWIRQSVMKAIHENTRIASAPQRLAADLRLLSEGFARQKPVPRPEPSNAEMSQVLDEKIAEITVMHKLRA